MTMTEPLYMMRCQCGIVLRLREKDFPIICVCGKNVARGPMIATGTRPSGRRIRTGPVPTLASAPPEEIARRVEICESCPSGHFTRGGFCALCPACNAGRKDTFARFQQFAGSKCPVGHWGKSVDTKKLAYITSAQRTIDTLSLIPRLPHNLAAVCGVARSGIAPAVELAMALHLPLFTLSEQHGVVQVGEGFRARGIADSGGPILVIDDSRGTGRSAKVAMIHARKRWPERDLIHAALYVNSLSMGRKPTTDLWVRVLDDMHLFEWNLYNSPFFAGKMAFDFDGVLCHDWPGNKTDDESHRYHEGDGYRQWLGEAQPLHLPRRDELPLVVTGRCEQHRPATVAWLARWGIRVKRLVMWDGDPDARWRGKPWAVAAWKADHFRAGDLELMVESSPRQAEDIARLAGKPVLCPAVGKVF